MKELFAAALELQQFFVARQWRFCFIGGMAVGRWGRSRYTEDVDASLFTNFGDEEKYVADLLTGFSGRISDASNFALTNRIVLLTASNGVQLDVGLAGFDYEADMMNRGSDHEFEPGALLRTVSAEDLVVLKAFADRPQDWFDIDGILTRQHKKLDWAYIHRVLPPLCEAKESPEILDRLEKLRIKTRD